MISRLNISLLIFFAETEAVTSSDSSFINELLKIIKLSSDIIFFMYFFRDRVFVECWLFLLDLLCIHPSLFQFFHLKHNVKIIKFWFVFVILLLLNLRPDNVSALGGNTVSVNKLALLRIVNKEECLVEWWRIGYVRL